MNGRLFFLLTLFLLSGRLVTDTVLGRTLAPQQSDGTVGERPAPGVMAADSVSRECARSETLSTDSLERLDPIDTDLLAVRRSAEGEAVVLEVAGFGITLSGSSGDWLQPADPEKPKSRVSPTLLAATEYGYNVLTGVNYGDYPTGSDRFFDLRNGKSFHLSSTLIGLSVELGRARLFKFSTGLRYTIDNFRLANSSITLGNNDGRIVPVALDEKADKSKLRITSLGLPLTFSCRAARHLTVALSGYFDFTMGANAIYKRPKVKASLAGVNTFRLGLGAAIAYHTVGVYVRYSVTPLFEGGAGPEVHPLSIGLCVDM